MLYNLIIFIILAVAISLSTCCPTSSVELLSLSNYVGTAELQRSPLQVTVNVTTTRGLVFQPALIAQVLKNKHGVLPEPNGCNGFYNFTSQNTGLDTICPWSYQCDFDPQRIPAFIFHAHCDSSSPKGGLWQGYCEEVYYPITYMTTESCNPLTPSQDRNWTLTTRLVSASCNLRQTSLNH